MTPIEKLFDIQRYYRYEEMEEGRTYIISATSMNDRPIKLEQVTILIKLRNSIKILKENEEIWLPIKSSIRIFDILPIKYLRKDKLKNIEENGNK